MKGGVKGKTKFDAAMTFAEIGRREGITREYAFWIYRRAIAKLSRKYRRQAGSWLQFIEGQRLAEERAAMQKGWIG